VRELGRVVKGYPSTGQAAQAQFMMGSCYESLRERRKAEEAYRRVLEIAPPQSPWAFEAQQSLVRLLEQNP
jgi:TolA-binding protein